VDNNISTSEAQGKALSYLRALAYLMAGDLESSESLEHLFERARSISWDDPDFINFSEEMRAGTPQITAEEEVKLSAPLSSLIYAASQRIASDSEAFKTYQWALKKMVKDRAIFDEYLPKIHFFARDCMTLSVQLLDRLQVLGDDVSHYPVPQIPPIPTSPETDVPPANV
jgi:hypothetical protein